MTRSVALLALTMLAVTAAEAAGGRVLSAVETRLALTALARSAATALSEDPSCKDDVTSPGTMSVTQGLTRALFRAVTDKVPITIQASCSDRPGYPRAAGQDYCRVAFMPAGKRAEGPYGLVFLIDWKTETIAPSSVACF